MKAEIEIPIKAQIINGGFEVKVAPEDTSWEKSQLGDYANRRGVYIHHSNGRILYVGRTTKGQHGTFAERLRREFQKKASGNSRLYKLLAAQTKPIMSYLLDLDDLTMMVDAGPANLDAERKALIMELVLIGIYKPEGNVDGNNSENIVVSDE